MGDVIYKAMVHLDRDKHWIEDVVQLCEEHPDFQQFSDGLQALLQDKQKKH